MSNLTVAELETEVRYCLGSDTDEESTRIRRWLKTSYEFVCNPAVYKHPELESTETLALIAGSSLTTSTVWNSVELVRYYQVPLASVATNQPGWRLGPTSFRMLQERSSLVQGEPRRYAFRANTFLWDRYVDTATVGNGVLIAGYERAPTVDFTDDSDTLPLREEWDQIVIYYASMHGFTAKGQTDRALGMREMAAKLTNDMPPIQGMSAEDWDDEMQVTGGPGDYPSGGMRRGRSR